ncbi:MAG: CbrC family protein [Armatimonadetes bacterium]|nr:CbrC family protein [Armatimonadota bacterium]
METSSSPFRYFRDPHHFSSYTDRGEVCPFCNLTLPGYGGGFSGEAQYDDLEFICETCLLDGKLIEKGLATNQGCDVRPELRQRHPELDEIGREALAQQRIVELEQRTPPIMTWQGLIWPSHCGDYCCFIKEAGQLDMNRLAPDGNGRVFFEAHLDEPGRDDIWEGVRPDAPTDNAVGYSVGVYLFQCLECGEYLIRWDCD